MLKSPFQKNNKISINICLIEIIFFIFSYLVFFSNCTGVYYGIDGPNVLGRNEAVAKLNRALFLKSAECGFDEKNLALLLNNYTVNPRKVLDGAYYAKKDVEACEKRILLSDCNTYLTPCGMSPKGFFDGGGLFQGGF